MNKVTSKLVHPTAFSVLAFSEEEDQPALRELRPILFNTGTRYALDVYGTIKGHVDKYGMEPG